LDTAAALVLMKRAYRADGFAADTSADHFAQSSEPRNHRPVGMKFRVGDVFFHGQTGALGIVLGWDDRRRAPLTWGRPAPERLYAVHYSVLEWRAASGPRYIVEENMLTFGEVAEGRLARGKNPVADDLHGQFTFACQPTVPNPVAAPVRPSPGDAALIPGTAAFDKRGEAFGSACDVLWLHPDYGVNAYFTRRELNYFLGQVHLGAGFLSRDSAWREFESGNGFMPNRVLLDIYPLDVEKDMSPFHPEGCMGGVYSRPFQEDSEEEDEDEEDEEEEQEEEEDEEEADLQDEET
jgi:hypothetical protein